jgi:iron(II)-dependent oxidoreductase
MSTDDQHLGPIGQPISTGLLTEAGEADIDKFKALVAAELERVRDRSFGLTTNVLDDAELTAQHSRLMSPLVWDLAHVGNYEELWLLRAAAGIDPMRPEIDDLYDAFEHPRSERPTLPLLSPTEAQDYIALVRRKVLDSLETIRFSPDRPLLDAGFVYRMVIQHEHQHDETMLATHQLRRGAPVFPATDQDPAPRDDRVLPAEVLVEAGDFVMGTSTDTWALDNERPAHTVSLPAYWIDTMPVSNAAYRAFVADGGYDQERWWTPAGWQWRCASGKRAPAFWVAEGDQWLRRRFGHVEPLPDDEPVQHVSWYEADAYARWAGRRLPTEAEWEKAASWDPVSRTKHRFPWGDEPPDATRANLGQRRYRPAPVGSFPEGASPIGARQMLGDVWEWTSTDFTGHPGFCVFPYREYSEVFFGNEYKVLRGGSWASDPTACRTTFRNWDYPIRRQIFAGFRCARDA